MQRSRLVVHALISSTLLASSVLLGTTTYSVAQGQPSPTAQLTTVIRSTTRLVQISVAVSGSHGQPIPGLTQSDFTVLDQGVAQKIAFFSAPLAASTAPPSNLPANVFTNRTELRGQDPGAITVILFDALNTVGEDQTYVQKQLLKFLQTMKPQDHVALYALAMQLELLQDFTQDSAALAHAASGYNPKELAMHEASDAEEEKPPDFAADDRDWGHLSEAITKGDTATAELALQARILVTTAAFQKIAERLADIPGRKNLVWISGGFPVDLTGEYPKSDRDPQNRLLINRIIESLNRSNTVIYAVDTHGITINPGMGADARLAAPLTASLDDPVFGRQDTRHTFRELADRTGGRAFFGTNRAQDALTTAFNDGRFAYTIGYYPAHGQWDGKYRKVSIELRGKHAQLRYRHGYFAALDQPKTDEDDRRAALHTAAVSPLDSAGLGMLIAAKAVPPTEARNVELRIHVDPKQFLLLESQGHFLGNIEIFYLQRDDKSQTVAMEGQQLDLNFEDIQFQHLAVAGMILERHLVLDPEATELRTVLWDKRSGAIGSVTVPVAKLLIAEEPKEPGDLPAGTPLSK